MSKSKGTVKKFQGGHGTITPENGEGELFVHFKNIRCNGFAVLHPGEKVTFDIGVFDRATGPTPSALNVCDADGQPFQCRGGFEKIDVDATISESKSKAIASKFGN